MSVYLGFRLEFSFLSYRDEQMTVVLQWCVVTGVMLWLLKRRDHGRLMHWTKTGESVLFAVVFL